ncbi:hypothetical protein DACRYDRAFT_17808 [Dacryopinax primogenitus]|uniref:Concanavalin A-like lectin/glucanase n=1 Tax=Dacryopinax primogenitus (strain DJM 731) TaxID=1858805 RepID=M5FS34_DACPD|nr:uncharacterized protein DACRYDRAFT_17808 [Dacryopinax primogenitus]EJT98593.1 hypothetical protein DACRYDRAFT_17808 [Dacryopinax primogenitus]
MLAALALLGLAATPALGISISLILPDENVWTQMNYTITVPPPVPSGVTQGPWWYTAGLQAPGGMLAPGLQWGEDSAAGFVNPNVTFPKVWSMVLWTLCANDKTDCHDAISQGVYADLGAKIRNTAVYDNGFWTQQAEVISGGGRGASVNQTISAASYFDTQTLPAPGTSFFLLESAITGPQSSAWNFNVTFTDISLTAQNSTGVASLCGGQTSTTDGNGFITINGFEMSSDGLTCHWDSMILSP